MSEPMTDERRKEIEKELKPRYYVGEKVFLLASVVRECLDEIARLKGLGKKQIDRAEEIIGQLVDENTTLKEENRKMRELLDFAAGLLEVEYEDDGVAEWQVAYRAFLDGEEL